MRKTKAIIVAVMLTAVVFPAMAADGCEDIYRNPVIPRSAPDPTVIRAQDGYFYLYSTEDVHNVPIYKSKDLVQWAFVGTAFTDESRPKWNPNGNIWAPDINYINGKYVLYYSKSEWGGIHTCGIGVATADRPEGPFTDHGNLFVSKDIGVTNSIDQFYIEERGHKYLFWGSFFGIYGIELSADGLSLLTDAKPRQIAGTFMEGTYIHKHGDYYYLFGSSGTCCEGAQSTYHITYGRSENLFGPYVDKQGRPLLENHFEVLIHGNEQVAGPGHNAEFVTDDSGADWILYHGFKRADAHAGRLVWLDRVEWIDGWPHVAGNQPSEAGKKPLLNAINLADPTIFAENGTYYLYGTSMTDGFKVYTSKDLKTWEVPAGATDGLALRRGEAFGTQGFWAPQVFKRGNRYYMYYTANEQLAVAEAQSPLGPFKQKKLAALPAKVKEIDPFVFFDDDGKAYLYHVRLIDGNRIYVAELNKNLTSVKENTARECISAGTGWEDTANAPWRVCEGPTVAKIDSTYYMFYSCNDFHSKDYAVGYATAKSPLGPWTKCEEPLISQRLIGANGTGHGDLFKDSDGDWAYVFHTHGGADKVVPRRAAVVKLRLGKQGFEVAEGSFRYLCR